MYSACAFCRGSLGTNRAIERFAVGRRVAFDAARGRLWAVCPRCARWNLAPLDERWEAVEECERLFRATPLRASTDHVGLARIAEGTELIRVGAALRPELAVWRYGRRFQRRYLRAAGRRGLVALGAGSVVGGFVVGAPVAAAAAMALGLGSSVGYVVRQNRVVALVVGGDGRAIAVRRRDLDDARLMPDGAREGWALLLTHVGGLARLEGPAAAAALGRLAVRLNDRGAPAAVVDEALARLALAPDADAFLAATAQAGERLAPARTAMERGRDCWSRSSSIADRFGTLSDLTPAERLALEMALHESTERRALDGELATLEESWRAAERVAAIADGLLVPESVEAFIHRHRGPPTA